MGRPAKPTFFYSSACANVSRAGKCRRGSVVTAAARKGKHRRPARRLAKWLVSPQILSTPCHASTGLAAPFGAGLVKKSETSEREGRRPRNGTARLACERIVHQEGGANQAGSQAHAESALPAILFRTSAHGGKSTPGQLSIGGEPPRHSIGRGPARTAWGHSGPTERTDGSAGRFPAHSGCLCLRRRSGTGQTAMDPHASSPEHNIFAGGISVPLLEVVGAPKKPELPPSARAQHTARNRSCAEFLRCCFCD